MLSRRAFAGRLGFTAAAGLFSEFGYAQRAVLNLKDLPKDMVWLNANEHPDGPPAVSVKAMGEVLTSAGRYHYQEFPAFYQTLAASED